MTKKILYAIDRFDFKVDAQKLKQEYSEIKDSDGKQYLAIEVDVTHGGYVNSNKYYYEPDGQAQSVLSWFTPYPKPVLAEHDGSSKPIGRTIAAAYIPLNVISSDNRVPKSKIRVKSIITDEDGIKAILNKEYLTVSSGSKPIDAPKCSICDTPGKFDGYGFYMECEHVKGQVYEDKNGQSQECYIKFGKLDYREYSFVNMPADYTPTHVASVVSARFIGENEAFKNDNSPGVTISNDSELLNHIQDSIKKEETKNIPEPEKKENKTIKTSDNTGGEDMAKKDLSWLITSVMTVLDECQECGEDGDTSSFWEDKDKQEVIALDKEYMDVIALLHGEDAVITPEKRKAMRASTFCGPDRTFPVSDCKHCATAMAMLNWPKVVAKYSASSRSRIASCVRTKAKSMSCPMSKSSDAEQDVVITWEDKEHEELLKFDSDFIAVMEIIDGTKLLPVGTERDAMAEDNFIGVKRTVQVSDCKHAAVALAMLNWPKVSSKYADPFKTKLASAINAKSKKMGCNFSKPADADSTNQNTSDSVSKEELVKTKAEVETLKVQLQEKDALIKTADDKISTLTKEIKDSLIVKVIDMSIALNKPIAAELIKAEKVEDKDKIYNTIKEELSKKENKDLTDSIVELEKEVKTKKLENKVGDPTLGTESDNKNITDSTPAKGSKTGVKNQIAQILFGE